MKRNCKNEERIHLTDHFTYQIIDNVIYLFEESSVTSTELQLLFKKVALIIEDEDISYINVSVKNIEERKEYYMNLGFSLSYYSIDKLNALYKGYPDKKAYRCYAFMTKNDFLNINSKEGKVTIEKKEIKKENNYNKGFVNSMLLLLVGITLICYLCIEGFITIIKLGR